jgi:N-acetylmuramoyl-L-alanine amidase
MPTATKVNNLVLHTSAGFSGVEGIENFWRDNLGWKSKGYSVLIETDGTTWYLNDNTARHGYTKTYNKGKCFEFITNGVAGNNSDSVHICYIGGIEVVGKDSKGQSIYKGKDTRTPQQKASIEVVISQFLAWCIANGKDVCHNFSVVGHRDFSKDQNNDGVITSWERIKECPCFDAMKEYGKYTSEDRRGILPTVKTPTKVADFKFYTVVSGDSLSKIAIKLRTTIMKLKKDNSLNSDLIQIGQKLKY